ncbi:MAG: class I SAM-dependent methyltransferase [Candidatus Marinimicrobia bacterium]|nr:class I SAM-dependent methyltransferase [Candidatus Neomarinimicrobiota bacterium]MCF7830264.1 class I SAM-dependent methyltransferase [Candidatus Neomarinimicrobiota bacterium]MCF7882173.1 class I SAM-dependent methyltransferase [Candidatus Neomarinimicrobiota bacterium]
MPQLVASEVQEFYGSNRIYDRIVQGLMEIGKDPDQVTVDDLAVVDEFHIRGRESTEELLQHLSIQTGDSVLDVGCGLGGACRYIASKHDAEVFGVDVTEDYCKLARKLTEDSGFSSRIRFRHGDALDLPFEDEKFEKVLTIHTQMNIADKAQFYGELFRVLKPGGRLAFYDIFADNQPVILPVPWADDPSLSHMISHREVRNLLHETGFQIDHWRDDTSRGLQWFQKKIEKVRKEGPPPLGIHLLIGSDAPRKMKNVVKNIKEDRIKLIQAVLSK